MTNRLLLRRLAALTIPLVLGLLCATPASTADVREVVRSVEACTAVVRTENSLGSGFLISSDGLLVTNHHVVAGARSAAVRLNNGDVYEQVWRVAEDAHKDFAVLRIAGFNLPSCMLADSSTVEVGQEVIAIGNPQGLDFTVSTGIVSALRTDLAGTELGYRVIQTTAPISPGSSGGPLLDAQGRVIGITTFKLTTGENLNFAVPINYVRGAVSALGEAEKRGTPLNSLAWQAQAARKDIVSFRNLSWGMPLAAIEKSLGRRLAPTRKARDPLDLKTLGNPAAYTVEDMLLGRKLAVDLWLDKSGLGAVTIVDTLKGSDAAEFLRDLLSALGRNYAMPADGGAGDDGLWAVWSDSRGNAVSLRVAAVRCGRLPLPRGACYDLALIYLRSEWAEQLAQRLGEQLDPF